MIVDFHLCIRYFSQIFLKPLTTLLAGMKGLYLKQPVHVGYRLFSAICTLLLLPLTVLVGFSTVIIGWMVVCTSQQLQRRIFRYSFWKFLFSTPYINGFKALLIVAKKLCIYMSREERSSVQGIYPQYRLQIWASNRCWKTPLLQIMCPLR